MYEHEDGKGHCVTQKDMRESKASVTPKITFVV